MPVSIGDLRHRLVLERLDAVAIGGGAQEATWTAVATLSAKIVPLSGREASQADSFHGTISHKITLRYRGDIVSEMRFRTGSRVFNIRAVFDVDERRHWLVCDCEEERL